MTRFRRLLWWLHHRYALPAMVLDVTGDPGERVVLVSMLPHLAIRVTPEEADAWIEGLTYQARVARGEAPPRHVDYWEDR